MGGLDINEITIGYSSTGAAKYVENLNTGSDYSNVNNDFK